jgi:DNA-binding MarR family transcriptional regulator
MGMSGPDPKWHAFYGMLQVNARLVERIGARMERETGLPPAWFEVLAQISKGPVRMGDLAEMLVLSRGGATRLVARMEEAELVVREIPKDDRRATYARITDTGLAALQWAEPMHMAAVNDLFSRFITEEQAEVLRQVYANVLLGNGIDCAPVTDGYSQTQE